MAISDYSLPIAERVQNDEVARKRVVEATRCGSDNPHLGLIGLCRCRL